MKRTITQLLMLVCIVLCSSMSVNAQVATQRKDAKERIAHRGKKSENLSLPTVKKEIAKAAARANKLAEQQPALSRVRARAEERTDVVLLDSIKDDEYCVHYGYNEMGWLVSEKYYNIEEGVKVFDTEDSYFLEYEFDEQGRCTRYAQFLYNADETKGAEMQRVVVTWKGGNERTEEYFALAEDLGVLYPTASVSYDKYGNYSLMIFYDWDDDTQQAFVEEYWEMKFKGNVMEYYYDEEGNLDGMDFNEDLFERLCYYYLDYNHRGYDDEAYYTLSGYKTDEVVDGLTITRTYYEVELDESEGDVIDFAQLDSYWEEPLDKKVYTLTPSRDRYASIYFYEPVKYDEESDNMADAVVPEGEKKPMTRAAIEMRLYGLYTYEWDKFGRLMKWESRDNEEGDSWTYSCSYRNDKYNKFTFEEYDVLMHDDDGHLGETYGEVCMVIQETLGFYLEEIIDKYDAEGRQLHSLTNEIYLSDEEVDQDMNGDGIISTERETYKTERWYTYDADSKSYSRITCHNDAEVERYDEIDEQDEENDGQYIEGYREYVGTSKDGPWTLTYEDMQVFRVDATGNIYQMPIAQWSRSYDVDSQTWWGYKYEINDGIITKEYTVDSQTGEFVELSVDTDTPSNDELQEGDNKINFVENGWEYRGNIEMAYQQDEESQKDVLKIVYGWMEIRWVGGNGYLAENPAENYKFPVGMYFESFYNEAVGMEVVTMISADWNSEENKWMTWGEGTLTGTTYFTNANGQVVEEYNTYTFDGESGRMVLIPDAVVQTIYSFDEQGRLSTIEDGEMVLCYTYLEGYDYLLEAYALDKATNEKVYSCKYFYSNGSYTPPVITQIENTEAASKTVIISGATVIADGFITLYNAEGQVVARGNGIVTAPQSGLYIVAVGQERVKVCIK